MLLRCLSLHPQSLTFSCFVQKRSFRQQQLDLSAAGDKASSAALSYGVSQNCYDIELCPDLLLAGMAVFLATAFTQLYQQLVDRIAAGQAAIDAMNADPPGGFRRQGRSVRTNDRARMPVSVGLLALTGHLVKHGMMTG